MSREDLFVVPTGVHTRWASPENVYGRKGTGGRTGGGRKGCACFYIRPGETLTLARVRGQSGVIRRIWATIQDLSPLMLKQLRLQIYWDGADRPAVDVPFGDFFGMGLGRMTAFEGALFSSPEGRSFNCFIPMPFRTGMEVRLVNEGRSMANMFYYDIDYTVGDEIPEDAAYFHAWYHHELPTRMGRDYTVLDSVYGRGRFLGASFGVAMNRDRYGDSWGGEGEVKFYIDGAGDLPTLCGTGTEDYVGTGWCQGQYSHPTQGFTVADDERMHLCFYRYHVPDPVYFHESLRVTIQQIGSWNPELLAVLARKGEKIVRAGITAGAVPEKVDPAAPGLPPYDLFEREDHWTSCSYFYLDSPVNSLPPLPPLRERTASIPNFDEKELDDMKEMPHAALLRHYIPQWDSLDLPELAKLSEALRAVVAVMDNQQEALRDDGDE